MFPIYWSLNDFPNSIFVLSSAESISAIYLKSGKYQNFINPWLNGDTD